jgi:DMSO reductase anchor subunit
MKPTRPRVLVVVTVVIAAVTWLLLGLVYRRLPPLPWTSVPTLLILAIAEAYCGVTLRARLSGRTAAKPIEPIGVARMAALAKASSYAASLIAGIAAGFSLYVLGSLDKAIPRQDALAAVGTLAAAIFFGAAAVFLERCCRTRRDPDDGDQRSRTLLR